MSFEGVIVNKGQGGLNRQETSTDATMALVVVGTPLAGVDLNKIYELISLKSAENLGIDKKYDVTTSKLVHHHISEFFRLAPNGVLKFVLTDKVSATAFFESVEAKSIFRADTESKRIGFVYNENQAVSKYDQEITACQVFINELLEDKIYLDGIYLEGRAVGYNAPDLRVYESGNVSTVIAQDPIIASLDPNFANYAAVGSVLGMRAARKVNENLGSVDIVRKPNSKKGFATYPLTDKTKGLWLSANLSDGTPVSNMTMVEQKALTANGYVFAGSFQGFAGVYFNGEPTCIAISSDYNTGENNGVWNKAALGIRNALLPKVRGWFQRNPETGALKDTAITNLENIGKKPLEIMQINEEISGYSLVIPAGQNPTDQTPLQVEASVTLGAIIHTFVVDLSLV